MLRSLGDRERLLIIQSPRENRRSAKRLAQAFERTANVSDHAKVPGYRHFNAMVVFESGLVRWVGVLLFVAIGVAWLMQRGRPRLQWSS
ncbi:MAG: hypothetical protein AB7G28_07380 [Pirellulales bacterium]